MLKTHQGLKQIHVYLKNHLSLRIFRRNTYQLHRLFIDLQITHKRLMLNQVHLESKLPLSMNGSNTNQVLWQCYRTFLFKTVNKTLNKQNLKTNLNK